MPSSLKKHSRSVWALADLHLSLEIPSKDMSIFGSVWQNYMEKISSRWKEKVQPQDLVLLPGDICWALKLEQALPSLYWIDKLPGTKVMIRGNHDYWWSSAKKMSAVFPPSVHFINNTAFHWHDISIGGTRLWESSEYNFKACIDFSPNLSVDSKENIKHAELFEKELERLRMSLKQLNPQALLKIAMVHYPPISLDLKSSRTSKILEEFRIQICVFGHLHNVKKHISLFGEHQGVQYYLTSVDYLDFTPLKIYEF